MHRLVTASAVLVILQASLAPAPAQDKETDAQAIIQRAIDAQGGKERLLRANASYRKLKGVFVTENFKFNGETWSETGNRLKVSLRSDDDNNPEVRMLVQNGELGWNSYNGFVWPFDEQTKKRMAKSAYADKVCGLVALLRDSGYTLTLLGDSKVKDMQVVGIRVQSAGQNNVFLYFDKDRHTLVKAGYLVTDATTHLEVFQEVYYSKFATYDPVVAERQTLEAHKQPLEDAALLKYLRERIPTAAESEQIAGWIGKLGEIKFAARQKATAELQKFGSKAASQLRKVLQSDDREVVGRAEGLLDALSKGAEARVATAVVRLLAVRRPAGVVEALLDYVPWACDSKVAREVLDALVTINDAAGNAHPVLVKALEDGSEPKRKAAAAVLGKDGGTYLKQPWRRVVVEGLVLAHHVIIYRDGKLYMEYDSTDHQFYNSFGTSFFVRP